MKKNHYNKGYALIYALLFIILLMLTVGATLMTSMVDIRLQRRSENSVQANELAKRGIDDGWSKYKSEIGKKEAPPSMQLPPRACNKANSQVYRVTDLENPNPTPLDLSENPPTLDQKATGVYDYNICTESNITTIEGIGYYRGNKITLRGTITHLDTSKEDPPGSGIETFDHSLDIITISQVGPSS